MASETENMKDSREKALLDGDHDAFEEMVRRETPRLFRVIRRMTGDDEARSLVQETFLQAYEGLDSFRGDASFSTWLISIGINQARSALRKKKRRNVMSEEDIERLQPDFRMGRYVDPPKAWRPEQEVERSQRHQLVREAVDRLPESYRTVIMLRDLEELSTTETAQILDITEGNVRVRLHRARRALQAELEDYFKHDSP